MSPDTVAVQESVPDCLGNYRLLRPIGAGGMARVNLAASPDGRLVAVKDTPEYLAPEVIAGQRAQAPADVHACPATSQRPSAAWLARAVARLDLAAPALPSTRPFTRPPRLPARRRVRYQRPDEVADLLPSVQYALAVRAGRRQASSRPRRHRLLPLAVVAMAVGLSLLWPVAGTLAVALLLTLFRAVGRARQRLAVRRAVRGPRPRDGLLLAGSIPWALVRSVTETVLFAPILLAAAAIAVSVAAAAAGRGGHVLSAGAAVAAVYTTLSCLGSRSRPAHRELRRACTALASNPLAAGTTLVTLVGIAMAIASLILVKALPLWPFPGMHSVHFHIPGASLGSRHR